MKLCQLLDCIEYEKIKGDVRVEVSGISTDSRRMLGGEVFVCYEGVSCDSHDFAADACRRGACAVVCRRELDIDVPQIIVKDGRAAVAPLARAFYGCPDKKLKIVGVTGTNGKTTTTYMLKSIFDVTGGTERIDAVNRFSEARSPRVRRCRTCARRPTPWSRQNRGPKCRERGVG